MIPLRSSGRLTPLACGSLRARLCRAGFLTSLVFASLRARLRRACVVAVATLVAGGGLVAKPALGLPLISEVFYDAVGSDNGHSFVEVYGAPGMSLEGLVLEGVNGANGGVGPTVALAGAIPGDGLFVVADDQGDGTTLVSDADLIRNFDFQNGPDSIVLRSADAVLDAVGYGTFASGEVFAGEGQPAPDAPAGASLARQFADIDSDDNLADFAMSAVPTPGAAPFAGLPEPSTGVLLAVGLVGLVHLGGRRPPPGA
jgi:hypothetical protein